MKRDRPVNFYNPLEKKLYCEKSRYLCNHMTDLREIWQSDAEWVLSAPAIKNFNFKIPRWRSADATLFWTKLRHCHPMYSMNISF